MTSRHNVVAMRRRWGSHPDDPGWTAWLSEFAAEAEPGGRRLITERIKKKFLARESIVDCPSALCAGRFVMRHRLIERHGSGARVVLRCTREPHEHDVTLAMEPYTPEEQEVLKALLLRGEQPVCARCKGELQLGSPESTEPWAKSVEKEKGYQCRWCGIRWVPPVGSKLRAG